MFHLFFEFFQDNGRKVSSNCMIFPSRKWVHISCWSGWNGSLGCTISFVFPSWIPFMWHSLVIRVGNNKPFDGLNTSCIWSYIRFAQVDLFFLYYGHQQLCFFYCDIGRMGWGHQSATHQLETIGHLHESSKGCHTCPCSPAQLDPFASRCLDFLNVGLIVLWFEKFILHRRIANCFSYFLLIKCHPFSSLNDLPLFNSLQISIKFLYLGRISIEWIPTKYFCPCAIIRSFISWSP